MKIELSDINIDTLQLEKLDLSGLKTLINWAKNEGWNPGQYDVDAFWAADTDGFYGYFYQKNLSLVVLLFPMKKNMGLWVIL